MPEEKPSDDGKAYLIDALVGRAGHGAELTSHPMWPRCGSARFNMWKHLPILLILSFPLAQAQKPKDEGWSDLLPPGESRDLVLNSCGGCHSQKVVVQARKSPAEWAKCVNDMIQRGSQLFPEEIGPITAYFVKSFGKDIPALINVNTAAREDLEKLPNFKPEVVARILEARGKNGPFKNSEELRRALGMEKEDFEKIHYRLEYSN